MRDALTIAGLLLVVGPLIGAVPVANPSLIPVWSAAREDHLSIVGTHRVAWAALNAGFVLATIATTAGLAILALAPDGGTGTGPARLAGAVAYAIGGALWCVVLAVRTRTTPALADLVRSGSPTEPGETLLGAALGGLFAAFVLLTAAALVVIGLTLLIAGGVAPAVAALSVLTGLVVAALLLATGDVIPAVLYVPTVVLGVAVLAGWT